MSLDSVFELDGDFAVNVEDLQKAFKILGIEDADGASVPEKCQRIIEETSGPVDILKIMDVMDCLDISTAGAETIEELKERLTTDLTSTTSDTHNMIENFKVVKEKFEDDKNTLIQLYRKFNDILKNATPEMRQHFTNEDTISDVSSDVADRQKKLENTQCTIVVSGETGAGKSTLLNLLLGENVLPHHAISCTSTICKIKYGPKRHVKITTCDGDVEEFDVKNGEETEVKMKKAMFQRNNRESGPKIKEVEMEIPSDILKSGLILVDTPGIGEYEAMEEILTTFLQETQIQGFIYVIRVDGAAGGIQEDRILKLLNIVIAKQNDGKSDPTDTCLYDSSAALFIFNRWDLVPDEEKEKVRSHAKRRILNCWPNLETSELLFMSAISSVRHLQNGFTTESYLQLISGMNGIVEKSASLILKRFFRWLNYMVSRSIHHTKMLFSSADYSEYEHKKKFEDTKKKMNALVGRSKKIFSNIRLQIDKSETELTRKLVEYLSTETAKNTMKYFTESDVDRVRHCDWRDDLISDILQDKSKVLMSDWKEMQTEFTSMQQNVTKQIKRKMFVLQEELDVIETDMPLSGGEMNSDWLQCGRRGTRPSLGIGTLPVSGAEMNSDWLQCGRRGTRPSLGIGTLPLSGAEMNSDWLQCGRRGTRPSLGIETLPLSASGKKPDWFPDDRKGSILSVSTWGLPVQPARINFSIMGRLIISAKKAIKKKSNKSSKDIRSYMERMGEEAIMDFLSDNNVKEFITSQILPIQNYLSSVEKSIPKLIETNKQLIKVIEINHEKHRKEKKKYEEALRAILVLKDEIAHYGYDKAFRQKIKHSDIKMCDSPGASFSNKGNSVIDSGIVIEPKRNKVPQALFYSLCPGLINEDEITIRKYFPNVKIESFYSEAEKLENLHHESVARFKGIMPTIGNHLPYVIYEGRFFSLRSKMVKPIRRLSCTSLLMEISPTIIDSVVSGLVYIHSKGLIHPEVSLDSIMVNWDNEVKLAGMALPRKIPIVDKEQLIGDNIYLAPEVLRGEVYGFQADLFGLGLMICELFTQKRVFSEESRYKIAKYMSDVDVNSILKSEYFDLIPLKYNEIIKTCLQTEPVKRSSAKAIWKILKQ